MHGSSVQSRVFSPLAQSKPVATRAGDFLFLSGQTPHDPQNGRLVTGLEDIEERAKGILDLKEYVSLFDRVISGPIAAQTFTLLANVKDILLENGMSLEHIVKTNIYVTQCQDLGAFYRVWKEFFPKSTTACSIVEIPTVGINPKIHVTMDCIAALPEKISLKQIERIPSDRPHIGLGGCAAVKAGDLIFISSHVGVNDEGKAILKCSELGREAQLFMKHVPMATARTEATVAQFWSISQQVNALLKKAGSSEENVVTFYTFVRSMNRELYITHPVRKIFYPDPPSGRTSFGMPLIFGNEDLRLQVDGIATLPGKGRY